MVDRNYMPICDVQKTVLTGPDKQIVPFVSVFGDLYSTSRENLIAEQFQYNINTVSLTKTETNGTVSHSNSMIVIACDTSTTATVKLCTKSALRYYPGTEGFVQYTALWENPSVGVNALTGLLDDDNGFFIGYKGTQFCVGYRSNGTDNVINKEDFNIDTLRDYDMSMLNIFRISFGYLGIAPITFWVLGTDGEGWIPFHTIRVHNTMAETHVKNPSLPVCFEIKKTSGTEVVTMRSGSWSAGIVGERASDAGVRRFSHFNEKSVTASTLTNVLTLKNTTTFQTKTNYVEVLLKIVSAAVEGTKPVSITFLRNATLGGTPSYTDEDTTNSVISHDTAGTTVTGGTEVFGFSVAKTDSTVQNVKIRLYPGDTMTIAAISTNATIVNATVAWDELF